jgi:hypothetical protein
LHSCVSFPQYSTHQPPAMIVIWILVSDVTLAVRTAWRYLHLLRLPAYMPTVHVRSSRKDRGDVQLDVDQIHLLTRTVSMTLCVRIFHQLYDILFVSLVRLEHCACNNILTDIHPSRVVTSKRASRESNDRRTQRRLFIQPYPCDGLDRSAKATATANDVSGI